MTPLDLKTKEEWEAILDRCAKEANMTACLMDRDGKLLFCRMDRFPLCKAIRENQGALTSICMKTNTTMLSAVSKTLRPEIDICEAGLLRLVVPILNGRELVGQIAACGLASKEEEIEEFLVSKELGVTEEQVAEMAQASPFGAREELEKLGSRLFEEIHSA
jgi:ligand-binding sensor protein